MKNLLLVLVIVSLSGVLASCNDSESESTTSRNNTYKTSNKSVSELSEHNCDVTDDKVICEKFEIKTRGTYDFANELNSLSAKAKKRNELLKSLADKVSSEKERPGYWSEESLNKIISLLKTLNAELIKNEKVITFINEELTEATKTEEYKGLTCGEEFFGPSSSEASRSKSISFGDDGEFNYINNVPGIYSKATFEYESKLFKPYQPNKFKRSNYTVRLRKESNLDNVDTRITVENSVFEVKHMGARGFSDYYCAYRKNDKKERNQFFSDRIVHLKTLYKCSISYSQVSLNNSGFIPEFYFDASYNKQILNDEFEMKKSILKSDPLMGTTSVGDFKTKIWSAQGVIYFDLYSPTLNSPKVSLKVTNNADFIHLYHTENDFSILVQCHSTARD